MSGEGRTLITGARIVADETTPPYDGEILFDETSILAIGTSGSITSRVSREGIHAAHIEASGAYVCPGFIDAHVHAEGELWNLGVVEGALAQGVTTLILGQDGCSWAPSDQATLSYMRAYFGPVNGTPTDAPAAGLSTGEMLAHLDGCAQNVATLVGQGTLRLQSDPAARTGLRGEALTRARTLLRESLQEGALGLSSGFDYLPSLYGDVEELRGLAQEVAAVDGVYASHLRAYGERVGEGLGELLAVGAASGVRVHASHLQGPPALIEEALQRPGGEELSFDMYPYTSSSTLLSMTLLPGWIQAEGPAGTLRAVCDPETRERLLATHEFTRANLARLTLSYVQGETELEGMGLVDAAEAAGAEPGEYALDLLIRTELQVGSVNGARTFTEDELHWILDHPAHVGGSDGIYQGSHPHPRGYGAFARMLTWYTREGEAGWNQAVGHLSAHTSGTFGLGLRGRLQVGAPADLLIIDPAGIQEQASPTQPRANAQGLRHVYVNGVQAWSTNGASGTRTGRALHPRG